MKNEDGGPKNFGIVEKGIRGSNMTQPKVIKDHIPGNRNVQRNRRSIHTTLRNETAGIPTNNNNELEVMSFNCTSESVSCFSRCMNQTSLDTRDVCNCDPACTVLKDCCSDYIKECGKNDDSRVHMDLVNQHPPNWYCETHLNITIEDNPPAGVWMVGRCSHHWPNNIKRKKCHSPFYELDADSYDSFVPVYSYER